VGKPREHGLLGRLPLVGQLPGVSHLDAPLSALVTAVLPESDPRPGTEPARSSRRPPVGARERAEPRPSRPRPSLADPAVAGQVEQDDLLQHLAELRVVYTEEHEPVLLRSDRSRVDTWREGYPYAERMTRGEYDINKDVELVGSPDPRVVGPASDVYEQGERRLDRSP
jgi:hypothetical protein